MGSGTIVTLRRRQWAKNTFGQRWPQQQIGQASLQLRFVCLRITLPQTGARQQLHAFEHLTGEFNFAPGRCGAHQFYLHTLDFQAGIGVNSRRHRVYSIMA